MNPALALILAAAANLVSLPPTRTGQCGWVHGRYAVYNGSGLRRIWVIGTHRIIALRDDDNDVPREIDAYPSLVTDWSNFNDALFGDFYVCAREPTRPGHMQHVRLLRTRNLIFRGKSYRAR